jgi:hypothetical protein
MLSPIRQLYSRTKSVTDSKDFTAVYAVNLSDFHRYRLEIINVNQYNTTDEEVLASSDHPYRQDKCNSVNN